MQQETVRLTGMRELRLRRMFERIVRATVRCPQQYEEVRGRGREIATLLKTPDSVKGPSQPKPKVDLAEQRRAYFETWYRQLGFKDLTVLKPEVSNREFRRRAKLGHARVYRPPTSLVSYEAYMAAVKQGNHWTIDHADRAKVGWEPTVEGYWFWAEVTPSCPRLKTSWNDLTTSIRLLSLEEYVIVWHATKAETGTMLDSSTWCWLRTRFGRSALRAGETAGEVRVNRCDAEPLAVPYCDEGGRLAEPVKARQGGQATA